MGILFWVKGIMGCLFAALGIRLIFNPTKFADLELDAMTGRIFGIILLLYGLFRMYNQYIEYKNSKGEE